MSLPLGTVAVIGPAEASPEEAGLAEEVGRRLAEAGVAVLCGGGSGVMEAVCRGAAAAGGMTVGILPGTDRSGANQHLSLVLPTGLGEARNAVLVTASQAVIAIGGSPGTLSEIGFALKQGRAVIGLKTWEVRDPSGGPAGVIPVWTGEQAVRQALAAISAARPT